MAILRVIVPTPHQHPGWIDHFFETNSDHNWFDYYKQNVSSEPARGPAWDTKSRAAHAKWKADFVEWLRIQDGIRPAVIINL